MRKHSDAFPLVLVGAVFVLQWLFKSIYEDTFKAWANKYIEAYFGPGAGADVMGRLVEIVPTFTLAMIIVWALDRYIHREYSARQLAFVRDLEQPEGAFGFYTVLVAVENTSPTIKLHDCRCEILELRDENNRLIEKNIALRTRGQQNKEVQGRFYLDQAASKELPLFEVDQSKEEVTVVNANGWDLTLDHGIYTAVLRGYGDSGEPDEMTVQLNSENGEFKVIDQAAVHRSHKPVRRMARDATEARIELSAALSMSQEGLFSAKYIQVSVRAVGNLIGCQVMLTEIVRLDADDTRVVYTTLKTPAGLARAKE
jgi:hypothetical protein